MRCKQERCFIPSQEKRKPSFAYVTTQSVPAQELGDPISFDYANITIKIVLCDAAIKEKYPMSLKEWEVTIQKIVDECNQEPKIADRVLMEWRAKLEKEPTLLQPFQIDEIVREVRGRLSNASR